MASSFIENLCCGEAQLVCVDCKTLVPISLTIKDKVWCPYCAGVRSKAEDFLEDEPKS